MTGRGDVDLLTDIEFLALHGMVCRQYYCSLSCDTLLYEMRFTKPEASAKQTTDNATVAVKE